jgi:hypothetical protein
VKHFYHFSDVVALARSDDPGSAINIFQGQEFVVRAGGILYRWGSGLPRYAAAWREDWVFGLDEKRKNRKWHDSQRNGLRKIMGNILLSQTPVRLDGWISAHRQRGQLIIAIS